MKHKRILAVVMVLLLTVAFTVPAFAAEPAAENVFVEAGKETVAEKSGEIWRAVFSLAETVILCLIYYIINVIRRLYTKFANSKEKRAIINDAVRFGEQTIKNLHGYDKFEEVKHEAIKALNQAHIPYTEDELDRLIESAVNIMNGGGKHLEK